MPPIQSAFCESVSQVATKKNSGIHLKQLLAVLVGTSHSQYVGLPMYVARQHARPPTTVAAISARAKSTTRRGYPTPLLLLSLPLLSCKLNRTVLAEIHKAALAIGAALSPTSLGFSAQLLGEVGQLTTPIGQLICTAAVIDDVLSLLLLVEVQALGDDNPKVTGEVRSIHVEAALALLQKMAAQ